MPLSTCRYFVYIASCSDGTKYTAGRLPVRVVYSEGHKSRSAAQQREAQLKRWSRAKKQALVDGDSPSLHVLARRQRG
jgi:putative endonuclease